MTFSKLLFGTIVAFSVVVMVIPRARAVSIYYPGSESCGFWTSAAQDNVASRLIPLSQVDQYLGRSFCFHKTHVFDLASIIPCRRGHLLATAWSGRHRAG